MDIIDIKHLSNLIVDYLTHGVVPNLPSLEHSGILSLMRSGVIDYGANNDGSVGMVKLIINKVRTLKHDE